MPWLVSVTVVTAPGLVSQKLGQPVPLSNLVWASNSSAPQPAHWNSGALFLVQRAGTGAFGAAFAQHAMLFGGELAFCLDVCVCHGVFLSLPNTSNLSKSY